MDVGRQTAVEDDLFTFNNNKTTDTASASYRLARTLPRSVAAIQNPLMARAYVCARAPLVSQLGNITARWSWNSQAVCHRAPVTGGGASSQKEAAGGRGLVLLLVVCGLHSPGTGSAGPGTCATPRPSPPPPPPRLQYTACTPCSSQQQQLKNSKTAQQLTVDIGGCVASQAHDTSLDGAMCSENPDVRAQHKLQRVFGKPPTLRQWKWLRPGAWRTLYLYGAEPLALDARKRHTNAPSSASALKPPERF